MTRMIRLACAAAAFAATLGATAVFADQDNGVANDAARALGAAQAQPAPPTPAAPVASAGAEAANVHCYRRSNGVEAEIACPMPLKQLPAQ